MNEFLGISFNLPIEDKLILEGVGTVILFGNNPISLKSDINVSRTRNICLIDDDAVIKWWIQDMIYVLDPNYIVGKDKFSDEHVIKYRAYTKIWIGSSVALKVFNGLGYSCVVDLNSGMITSHEYVG